MDHDKQNNFEALAQEENTFVFEQFSRRDALAIGLRLNENAVKYGEPIAIEITLNGLVVFRYFSEGSIKDSEYWLLRKRNTVDLMEMSSLRFMYWLELHGVTIADRKLNPNNYAAGGGGFPIRLRGAGMIGSICVSGLSNHFDDHQLIADTLNEFLTVIV